MTVTFIKPLKYYAFFPDRTILLEKTYDYDKQTKSSNEVVGPQEMEFPILTLSSHASFGLDRGNIFDPATRGVSSHLDSRDDYLD